GRGLRHLPPWPPRPRPTLTSTRTVRRTCACAAHRRPPIRVGSARLIAACRLRRGIARRSLSLPHSELLEETGAQLDLAGGDVDLDERLSDVIDHVEPLLVQVGRLDVEAEADEGLR